MEQTLSFSISTWLTQSQLSFSTRSFFSQSVHDRFALLDQIIILLSLPLNSSSSTFHLWNSVIESCRWSRSILLFVTNPRYNPPQQHTSRSAQSLHTPVSAVWPSCKFGPFLLPAVSVQQHPHDKCLSLEQPLSTSIPLPNGITVSTFRSCPRSRVLWPAHSVFRNEHEMILLRVPGRLSLLFT